MRYFTTIDRAYDILRGFYRSDIGESHCFFNEYDTLPIKLAVENLPENDISKVFKEYWLTGKTLDEIAREFKLFPQEVRFMYRHGMILLHLELVKLTYGENSIYMLNIHDPYAMERIYNAGIKTIDELALIDNARLANEFKMNSFALVELELALNEWRESHDKG